MHLRHCFCLINQGLIISVSPGCEPRDKVNTVSWVECWKILLNSKSASLVQRSSESFFVLSTFYWWFSPGNILPYVVTLRTSICGVMISRQLFRPGTVCPPHSSQHECPLTPEPAFFSISVAKCYQKIQLQRCTSHGKCHSSEMRRQSKFTQRTWDCEARHVKPQLLVSCIQSLLVFKALSVPPPP